MKVLITAALSARAYQVKRLFDPEACQILLADSQDIPDFMLKAGQIIRIPAGDSAVFTHELLKLCLDQQINVLLPLRAKELQPLAQARTLFDEYGIEVLVPGIEEIGGMAYSSNAADFELIRAEQASGRPDRGLVSRSADGPVLITAD